jgi:hypothetical protein
VQRPKKKQATIENEKESARSVDGDQNTSDFV